MDQNTLQI